MLRWCPFALVFVAATGAACAPSPAGRPRPAAAAEAGTTPAARDLTHVTQTPQAALEPSLASFSDGFVVSWYDTRDGHGEIYARALAADASPVGPEWRLTRTDHDAFEGDVQALGEADFVIGW